MDMDKPVPAGSLLICNACSCAHDASPFDWRNNVKCDCGEWIIVEPKNIVEPNATPLTEVDPALPDGDYAIVEMFGHTTVVGRMSEAEKFGTKFLALEPVFRGHLLPAMMIGGASIYALTPCSAEVALKKGAKSEWGLPSGVRETIPAAMLPTPAFSPRFLDDRVGDDDLDASLPF